ncbi:MAG: hypothetical protein IMZ52_01250 [Actinobacteria bacterium]|nr:hypothetical protein [Candidatus Atribacteria bacterium]MBE3093628.1 hypothetical protein [Actinomycetota bacterium]
MELKEKNITIEDRVKRIIPDVLNIGPGDISLNLSFVRELGISVPEIEVEEIINVSNLYHECSSTSRLRRKEVIHR